MKQHSFVVSPSGTCPFFVEALQYVPENSCPDGVTLLFLHAMNLHKETFHTVLRDLLDNRLLASDLKICDAWCLGESNTIAKKLYINEKFFEITPTAEEALYSIRNCSLRLNILKIVRKHLCWAWVFCLDLNYLMSFRDGNGLCAFYSCLFVQHFSWSEFQIT